MKWHPAMIKWYLYLRYRSSGAYEMLRRSGCLHLPSQRMLRDYTHVASSRMGFSKEVDEMLMRFIDVKSSRDFIGFCNMGDINN